MPAGSRREPAATASPSGGRRISTSTRTVSVAAIRGLRPSRAIESPPVTEGDPQPAMAAMAASRAASASRALPLSGAR